MSYVPEANQDTNVDLAAGQQVFVKIVSSSAWGSEDTAAKNIERNAFWAWPMPPAVAEAEIANVRNGI